MKKIKAHEITTALKEKGMSDAYIVGYLEATIDSLLWYASNKEELQDRMKEEVEFAKK